MEKELGQKQGREVDRRTFTIRLGKGEIDFYEEMTAELGISLSFLARTAIKLFIVLFKNYKKGGRLKLVHANGEEEFFAILELEGVFVESKKED